MSNKVVFSLEMQVNLSPEEIENVDRYKLGNEVLFSKERVAFDNSDSGSWGAVARNLAAAATVLTININDLVKGRVVECKDIVEMLDVEEQIRSACHTFNSVLQAAAQFDGDEIIEI